MPYDPVSLLDIPTAGVVPIDYQTILGYPTAAAPEPPPPPPEAPTDPALVTSPTQVPDAGPPEAPAEAPAPAAHGTDTVAAGAKVSQQGFSPSSYQAIQKGPHTQLEGMAAAARARAESAYAPINAEQADATQQAELAATSAANVESQKLTATAEAKLGIATAQQQYAAKEQTAIDYGRAGADAALSQYRAAVLDYATTRVNPAELWESAGKAGQFGMVMTAFVHDFLGAKGIKTSGLESINAAINRNIDSQLANLRQKHEVAYDFRRLWEMQRAQSASDTEARDRMRGFYLASATASIEAKMAGYDSKLALAKGQAAIAALRQEQVKNDLQVRLHIDNSANAQTAQAVSAYGHELAASSARYSADAHIKAAQIAANASKAPTDPTQGLVFDTSDSGKTVASRRFLPDVNPETRAKLREQDSKVKDTAANILHLADLQRQLGSVPPGDISVINRLQSEVQRTAETVRQLVRMGAIYDASGKQINEQEMKVYDQLFAKKDWFTNGENTQQLAKIAQMNLAKQARIMEGASIALQPGDPAYGLTSGKDTSAPGERTLADIESQPGSGAHVNTVVDNHIKSLHSPNAAQAVQVDDLPDDGIVNKHLVKNAWDTFLSQEPWAAPRGDRDYKRRIGHEGFWSSGTHAGVAADPGNPDQAFVDVLNLASYAKGGDPRAKQEIERLAEGKKSTEPDGLAAAYADWFKRSDPELYAKP